VTATVEFFFSPASRYSYLASTQMAGLERQTGCSVTWRPVHGPDIRRLRCRDPFSGAALSGQYEEEYRQVDAKAWAEFYGVPFREPREFYFDYELLVKGAVAGQNLGAGPGFYCSIADATYGSARWPLDRKLLTELAVECGLDSARFLDELDSEAVAAVLAASAREAFERGAFGVPTFFVGERMFWGNDRLPLVRYALRNL
jgi:2-hydroxychromene-2-carboxylate isomerase